jgi:hypothetical protein
VGQNQCGSFRCSIPEQGDGVVVIEHFEGVGCAVEVEVLEEFAAFGAAKVIQQVGQLSRVQQA